MEENKVENQKTITQKQEEPKKIPEKKNRTRMYIVLIVLAIAVLIGYISFRGEYLEIKEIGEKYLSLYWQNIQYTTITMLINFVIIFILVYTTNNRIKKGLRMFFEDEKKEMPKIPNKSISFIIAILVSAITSGFILKKALLCFNSAQFGIMDPIFGLDIGYFIFQQPFIELILMYALVAIVATTVYAVLYYVIAFNRYFDGVNRQTIKKSILLKQLINNIRILAILGAAFILVATQNAGTQKFLNLRQNTENYTLFGSGFTDVTISLWGYRLLSIVMLVSVFVAISAFKQGKTKKVLISIFVVPIYLVTLIVVMVGFKLIFVNSNELDKEKPYIASNISYTKNAYGVNISENNIDNGGTITEEVIANNADVLNSIAIVSKDIVLKDLTGSQTNKGYYSYRTTQIGNYRINGKDKLVYISPREIVSSNGTYNNKTYEYTHGYGAIVTSAATTNANGNLEHIQKAFEQSEQDAITITQPRIYFGLQTNDTVVTNTTNKKELDYPIINSNSTENAENIYDGQAGLSLNFIDRFILAIKEKDLKLAFTGNITSNSKILTNRNVINRAKTIMPDLLYDEEPYLVVNEDGKLIWVLDAYTTSNNYPYSQRSLIAQNGLSKTELNYIRNSVKVLIDAYDGTVTFYITDRTDPIAMAYRNIYPDLFADLEETVPSDISKHFVYPTFLYNVQAEIIERYHNIQPDVLYRNDDIWDVATHNIGRVSTKSGTKLEPYYTMVKTTDQEKATLGLVLPYTPYEKQNIISYLVGTTDDNGNNKLTLYKFPEDSNILGPMQLDTQLEQDETIAKEIESLNVNGTKMTKEMIIVPIDNTLLYIEPIYQQYINESNALPTLKKVVVASGNKVAIGDTLKEALKNLVSKYALDIEVQNTDTIEDLITAIVKANKNLENSSSNNDWEMIGKDMQKLQTLIKKLQIVMEEQEKQKDKQQTGNNHNTVDENAILENLLSNEITNTIP